MAGIIAFFHVLRRLLDILDRLAQWMKVRNIRRHARRRVLDEIRLRSHHLLEKARKARRSVGRRGSNAERMHADDGYRRD